jgi:hypothetical protein
VIARNSTFTYNGQAIDIKQVGRELGVRYILEGSVRKGDGRVRISAQLIEAETGAHLWADRFDGALEDVFDLQDKVASSVAGVIEPELQAAETARAARRPTADLTAYDAYLRAFAMLFSSTKHIPPALALLEDAITRDPNYGPALAWAAVCHQRLCIDGASLDPQAEGRKAVDYASRALLMAPEDPITLANAAMPLAYFGEDIGAMMALVHHALALNPSYARGWYISGILSMWVGDQEVAIERGKTALRLSPRGGIGTAHSLFRHALFLCGRFDEAVPKLLFGDPTRTAPGVIPLSRRLLRPYGPSGRGTRRCPAPAHDYAGCYSVGRAVSRSATTGALPFGPAPGDGRDDMTAPRGRKRAGTPTLAIAG